ncbi:hypothetical protein QAD02_023591 [Eretmocerus hayati]|uniref:Uncharacterized protein n=1 Tax=Eretmocerus hayati TaxID=131215 RepID=A0ACC2PWN6_9HYME|nr:hypothetical protein QAD02_023591 [Eretmocerus hayati]
MKLWFIFCSVSLIHCKPQGSDSNTGKNSAGSTISPSSTSVEERVIHHIEDEVLALNKSNDPTRDKRALGIILRGILEAMGYSVSPIQIASIANPTPAAQMAATVTAAPDSSKSRTSTIMMMMPSMSMPNTTEPAPTVTSAPPPPRQRETLRFTGVLNFGNNLNTTNLINHLAQYEQLFHRNITTTAAPPAAPPPPAPAPSPTKPSINPRKARVQDPLLVKIPLPIAPNLAPLQTPVDGNSADSSYERDEYSHGHSEEYHHDKSEAGKKGNFEEQGNNSHHSEEYEHNYEEHTPDRVQTSKTPKSKSEESEVRILKTGGPGLKHIEEKQYKKNQNVVNYSVENKKIHDPSEISEERPPSVDSKFRHSMYVDEPDWKQEHENKMYKLAAEQEAKAEALAEENAEREKDKSDDHEFKEDDVELHRSREKEIEDRYEGYENQYSKDDSGEEEDYEGGERDSHEKSIENSDDGPENKSVESSREEESMVSLKTSKTSDPKRPILAMNNRKESNENLKSNSSESSPRESRPNSTDDRRERNGDGKRRRVIKRVRSKTPIVTSKADEIEQNIRLRDSYGEALEKPGGNMDERIAGYIGMFKNPDTGVYEPDRIQEYESLQRLYDNPNLVEGVEKIQGQSEEPRNRYEEYELPYDSEVRNVDVPSLEPQSLTTSEYQTDDGVSEILLPHQRLPAEVISPGLVIPYTSPYTAAPNPNDYGPYYASYAHHYNPLNSDQKIISRLTSYDPTRTAGFVDRIDSDQQLSKDNIQKENQPVIPTLVTTQEKIIPADLILEREPKVVTAWPAPFDYVFDNSENKNVILDNNSREIPKVASRPLYSHDAKASVPADISSRLGKQSNNYHTHNRTESLAPRIAEKKQVRERNTQIYSGNKSQGMNRAASDEIHFLSDATLYRPIVPQQHKPTPVNIKARGQPRTFEEYSEPQVFFKTPTGHHPTIKNHAVEPKEPLHTVLSVPISNESGVKVMPGTTKRRNSHDHGR